MRKIFAIYLLSLLLNSLSFGQKDTLKIYHWSELKNYDPDTIFGLSFEKMKLENLPEDLKLFSNLKHLDLSKNKLSDLPDYIGGFQNLEFLNVSRNKLAVFPIEVCRLSGIKHFSANRNLFDRIPDCIGFCSNLETIDLWSTPVMIFPSSMQNLHKLKEMDLQGIKYSLPFQNDLRNQLHWVSIKFDPPCDCMK